jgi:hypothetical protein
MFGINDMIHKQSDDIRKQAKNNYKEQVKNKMIDNVNTTDTIDSSDQMESEKENDFNIDDLQSRVNKLNEDFKQQKNKLQMYDYDLPKVVEPVQKPKEKEKIVNVKISAEMKYRNMSEETKRDIQIKEKAKKANEEIMRKVKKREAKQKAKEEKKEKLEVEIHKKINRQSVRVSP